MQSLVERLERAELKVEACEERLANVKNEFEFQVASKLLESAQKSVDGCREALLQFSREKTQVISQMEGRLPREIVLPYFVNLPPKPQGNRMIEASERDEDQTEVDVTLDQASNGADAPPVNLDLPSSGSTSQVSPIRTSAASEMLVTTETDLIAPEIVVPDAPVVFNPERTISPAPSKTLKEIVLNPPKYSGARSTFANILGSNAAFGVNTDSAKGTSSSSSKSSAQKVVENLPAEKSVPMELDHATKEMPPVYSTNNDHSSFNSKTLSSSANSLQANKSFTSMNEHIIPLNNASSSSTDIPNCPLPIATKVSFDMIGSQSSSSKTRQASSRIAKKSSSSLKNEVDVARKPSRAHRTFERFPPAPAAAGKNSQNSNGSSLDRRNALAIALAEDLEGPHRTSVAELARMELEGGTTRSKRRNRKKKRRRASKISGNSEQEGSSPSNPTSVVDTVPADLPTPIVSVNGVNDSSSSKQSSSNSSKTRNDLAQPQPVVPAIQVSSAFPFYFDTPDPVAPSSASSIGSSAPKTDRPNRRKFTLLPSPTEATPIAYLSSSKNNESDKKDNTASNTQKPGVNATQVSDTSCKKVNLDPPEFNDSMAKVSGTVSRPSNTTPNVPVIKSASKFAAQDDVLRALEVISDKEDVNRHAFKNTTKPPAYSSKPLKFAHLLSDKSPSSTSGSASPVNTSVKTLEKVDVPTYVPASDSNSYANTTSTTTKQTSSLKFADLLAERSSKVKISPAWIKIVEEIVDDGSTQKGDTKLTDLVSTRLANQTVYRCHQTTEIVEEIVSDIPVPQSNVVEKAQPARIPDEVVDSPKKTFADGIEVPKTSRQANRLAGKRFKDVGVDDGPSDLRDFFRVLGPVDIPVTENGSARKRIFGEVEPEIGKMCLTAEHKKTRYSNGPQSQVIQTMAQFENIMKEYD